MTRTGKIRQWYVDTGDTVQKGQPVVTIGLDDGTEAKLLSSTSGTVTEKFFEADDVISVPTKIARCEDNDQESYIIYGHSYITPREAESADKEDTDSDPSSFKISEGFNLDIESNEYNGLKLFGPIDTGVVSITAPFIYSFSIIGIIAGIGAALSPSKSLPIWIYVLSIMGVLLGIYLQLWLKETIDEYNDWLQNKLPNLEISRPNGVLKEYYHILMLIPLINVLLTVEYIIGGFSNIDACEVMEEKTNKASTILEKSANADLPMSVTQNIVVQYIDDVEWVIQKDREWRTEYRKADRDASEVEVDRPGDKDFINAFQKAEKSIHIAERQAELLNEIEPINELMDQGLPDAVRKEVSGKLDTAHKRIAQGKFDEAQEHIQAAEQKAKSSVDFLIDKSDTLVGKAEKSHEQGNYENASDTFEDAIDTYKKALSLAPKLDREDRVPDIRESIADAERSRDRSRMYDLAQEGENQVKFAKQASEKGEYEQAIKTYENAHSIYARAYDIADEHGFEDAHLVDRLASIEQRIQAARIDRLEATLEGATALLNKHEYARAEQEFKDLLKTIDEADINDEEKLDSLRDRAQQGHLEAQIEQAREKRIQAENHFEQREYYEAREAFEDVREFLKPDILNLAGKYGFTEKKKEILKLDKLCEVNANEARRALHNIEPEAADLSSIDEIRLEEEPLTRSEDQSVPSAGRKTKRVDRLRSRFDHMEKREELKEKSDDKPEFKTIGDEKFESSRNSAVHKVELADSGEIAVLKIFFTSDQTIDIEDLKEVLATSDIWNRVDDHENIVAVDSFGFDGSQAWLLVEYLPNGSLRQYIGKIPISDVLKHITDVADALNYAEGIYHHDIKPDNILLDAENRAKLTDWETAKIAFQQRNQKAISPPYAAPEQLDTSRGPLDDKTDIYQLGVTAYELLTGELPYDPHVPEFKEQILAGQPQPPSTLNPDLTAEVDRVILRAMAADRDERYEKPIELRNDLKAVQNGITASE